MTTAKKRQTAPRRTRAIRVPREAETGPLCVVPDCDKPVYVRGLCEVHWADPKA